MCTCALHKIRVDQGEKYGIMMIVSKLYGGGSGHGLFYFGPVF